MGCLPHKKSKSNIIEDLKKKGFLGEKREVPLDKVDEVKEYQEFLLKTINLNYGLELTSLFEVDIKVTEPGANSKFSKTTVARLTPIESAFTQIDDKRKELGIYEDKTSIGEYNTLIAIEEEVAVEKEIKKLAEIREANAQSGFINENGDIFATAEEAMLSQEEDLFLEEEDYSYSVSLRNSAILNDPSYEDYLKQKENILKKVEIAIDRLYNEKRINPQSTTTTKISKLTRIQESLKREIADYKTEDNKVQLIQDYFQRDFDLIEELLEDSTLDNLFLAKEVFKYIESSANISLENRANSLFTPRSNTYYSPEVKNVIDYVAFKINDVRASIDTSLDNVFLNLLEKHTSKLATLYPEFVYTNSNGEQEVDLEEVKENLLQQLQDITWGESMFMGLGQNLLTPNNILDDLMVLEYEKASIRESAKAQKTIADIDSAVEDAQVELERLGKKITARVGKIVYSGYDYSLFYQKDSDGDIKPNLIGKFSKKWNDTTNAIFSSHSKKIFEARQDKDWAEVERLLSEKYRELNDIAEFVDFTLLHDVVSNSTYNQFRNPDSVAAQKYKEDLIEKIGEEEYQNIVEQQKNFLDNYMEEMRVITEFKMAQENVQKYSDLSDTAKINLEITEKRLNPLEFLKAHQSNQQNMVAYTVGTQSNQKPSLLKYNTIIPKKENSQGADTDFYDKDFDVINDTPALKKLWAALRTGSKTIAENLVDSDLKVSTDSILFMEKQNAELLMDQSFLSLVKRGLGKLLNVKGFLKNVVSAKRPNYNHKNDQVVLAAELKTIQGQVTKDYELTRTEMANLFNTQVLDKTALDITSLTPKGVEVFLNTLGVSSIEEFKKDISEDVFSMSELKIFSERRVMQSQTLNLPVLMKALLEISAEHKARTEAKNEMSVYITKSNSIKNKRDTVFNKKGGDRKSERERQQFWNERVVLNKNQKDLGGSISQSLITAFGKADFKVALLGQHFYKNFSKEEKLIYNSAVKRLKKIELELSQNTAPKKLKDLNSEKQDLEQRIRLLGKDYMFAALFDKVVNELTVKVGLGYNIVANVRNRFQAFFTLLARDGEFWSNGNIYPVNHFIGLNKLRFTNKNYATEWEKSELFIKQLGRIQDGTNELQKAESKLQKRARWFSPMYGTQVVEYYNQKSGILAMAMDIMVKDIQGNEEPLFNGEAFNVYKDPKETAGKLVLKDEFRTPENIAQFEAMDSEDMTTWKADVDNMTKSIAGDYSKTGITRIKGSIYTKPFMVFKTWLPRFISSRYRYEQKDIRTGQTETGYLLSTFLNKKTSVAGGLMLGVTALIGAAASTPLLVGAFVTTSSIGAALALYKKSKGQGPIVDPTELINIREQALFVLKNIAYTPLEWGNIISGKQLIKQPTFSDRAKLTPQEQRDVRLMARNMQTTVAFILVKLAIQALLQDNEEDEPKPEDEDEILIWEQKQKDKKEDKKMYNFVENQVTGMYQEVSLALDFYAMGSTLGSKNGLQNSMDKIVKISTNLLNYTKGKDELTRGERQGQSKLGNSLRKQFLPALIRDIGHDTWRGGLEGSMETEWDADEWMDGIFDSDYKKDKSEAEEDRRKIRLQIIEDYNNSLDPIIRNLTEDEKRSSAVQEALDIAPNPERENYDEKQNKIELEAEPEGENLNSDLIEE